jgi:hypothetical protein
MKLRHSCALLGAMILTASATPAPGGLFCKPALPVKSARSSAIENLQWTWSAAVEIDATPCASSSGRFHIYFVREKENAPELVFGEAFTWQTDASRRGRIEVSVDFWIDEAVLHYSAPYAERCPCRD